ncbi:MAG: hypothetical protein H7X95_13140, partial [Deltaproteobacteria bacterium]|nr:hypothetical protein [Deltaproteobacteria bacterium]
GGNSLCAGAGFIVCEGFETTAAGTNVAPAGWSRTGSVDVIADAANVYRGSRSLRINAAPNGPRRITKTGPEITALGGRHWGRIFFKVQTPAPRPTGGVIHSSIVSGMAMSPVAGVPGTGENEIRVVDTVENTAGRYQFLYNVQRQGVTNEFGNNPPYNYTYDGQWHCVEWSVDFATQNYHLYYDGTEATQVAVTNGAGNFNNSELPMVWKSISAGWYNYQSAGVGFVAWIDEIALDTNRIGCGN